MDAVITVLLPSEAWHALNAQWIILQEQFVKSQVDVFDHLNLLNQVDMWCWKYLGPLTQTGRRDIPYHRTLRMLAGCVGCEWLSDRLGICQWLVSNFIEHLLIFLEFYSSFSLCYLPFLLHYYFYLIIISIFISISLSVLLLVNY